MGMKELRRRIRQVQRHLRALGKRSVMVVSSGSEQLRSRDTSFPFRQQSDFYYLTGSPTPGGTLILRSDSPQCELVVAKRSAHTITWEGPGPDLKRVAREIGATFTVSDNPKEHIKKQLQGISHLVHQNTPETLSTQIATALFQLPSSARGPLPMTLSHSDLVLEPLRLRKDAGEQRALRLAASVTEQSLVGALRALRPGVTESSLAHEIDLGFAAFGGTTAFPTIVGTGPSAAALHHSPGKRRVGREDLVLIDCGAELDLYCADMTRTFPAAGRFSKTQRELYQAVLAAQTASLRSIRSGVTVTKVYDAAAEILIDFLIAKKIVKGSAKTVKKKGLFKPFFPHGIGHSLGLDVHDLGQLRPNTSARLESGMVFTVEPGLYFQKAVRGIAPCGIRIEDAVIVTPSGCKVLTPHVPKEPEEIEDLLAELDANAQR